MAWGKLGFSLSGERLFLFLLLVQESLAQVLELAGEELHRIAL